MLTDILNNNFFTSTDPAIFELNPHNPTLNSVEVLCWVNQLASKYSADFCNLIFKSVTVKANIVIICEFNVL